MASSAASWDSSQLESNVVMSLLLVTHAICVTETSFIRCKKPSALKGIKMPPYDDWNRIDDEEDEELQDTSVEYDGLYNAFFFHVQRHL